MRDENVIKKLWDKVTIEQWKKFLRVLIITMVFMVLSEGIFSIPAVSNFFGEGLLENKSGWVVYAIIWAIMFAQVAIIPIPALPIFVACNKMSGIIANGDGISALFSLKTLLMVIFISSATILGAIVSYWVGRLVGKGAVKWVAGSDEDYKKWSKKLNSKTGRWIYASTVMFPIFPDDLLAIIVGSIKLNFGFYVIVNIVSKIVGTYCTFLFLRIPGLEFLFNNNEGFPIALTVYLSLLIVSIVAQTLINSKINRDQPKHIKCEVANERVLRWIKKQYTPYKELLVDYKLGKSLRTYLNSDIRVHQLYDVDERGVKTASRVVVLYKISNYWQMVFNESFELGCTYSEMVAKLDKRIGIEELDKSGKGRRK